MEAERKHSILETVKGILKTQKTIIYLVVLGCFCAIIIFAILSQKIAENDAFSLSNNINPNDSAVNIKQYEVYKLAAEIRQIRSDTSGSLFWLKVVALFVTVGGAVGGYLVGQERVNKNRLNFEQRKNIDTTYQAIVQELSSSEAVLRATAAVKLGAVIKNFPEEWNIYDNNRKNEKRKEELSTMTKNVLAAALAIEKNDKVLKVISIALVPKTESDPKPGETIANLSLIDFSRAKAKDAFWAYVDFSNSDFFAANLQNASLRSCKLYRTSFYKTDLSHTVFKLADCREAYFNYSKLQGANFKDADLRNANLTEAVFDEETNFAGAKVFGMTVSGEYVELLKDVQVDISEKDGDKPNMVSLKDWLNQRK